MGSLVELHTGVIDPEDPIALSDVSSSQVYSVRQVATLLGMNLGLTYELVRRGEIPAKRLGKRWIIPRCAFDVWLNTPSAERR
jgi:excisionase family DNA binding protein